jgi:UDP-3-O-[3-hydroxymyristoyl] glucosamine N-acyltransferase
VGHIHIGDNTTIGAQAGVTKSVPENSFITGYPAREHIRAKREEASLTRLPELLKRVKALEQQVEELAKIIKNRKDSEEGEC